MTAFSRAGLEGTSYELRSQGHDSYDVLGRVVGGASASRTPNPLVAQPRGGRAATDCAPPTARQTSVEPRGLEPLTPCLQSRCATNCAKAPCSVVEERAPASVSKPPGPLVQALSTLSVACCHRACSCLPWSIFFFAKTAPAAAIATSKASSCPSPQHVESGPVVNQRPHPRTCLIATVGCVRRRCRAPGGGSSPRPSGRPRLATRRHPPTASSHVHPPAGSPPRPPGDAPLQEEAVRQDRPADPPERPAGTPNCLLSRPPPPAAPRRPRCPAPRGGSSPRPAGRPRLSHPRHHQTASSPVHPPAGSYVSRRRSPPSRRSRRRPKSTMCLASAIRSSMPRGSPQHGVATRAERTSQSRLENEKWWA